MKKRALSILLVLCMVMMLLPTTAWANEGTRNNLVEEENKGDGTNTRNFDLDESKFEYGDGTQENPFHIQTVEQLNAIRENLNAHYIQTSDIDLSGIEWSPIGQMGAATDAVGSEFSGSYDGNGYKISNLTISKFDSDNVCIGLFGVSNGIIKNITLENCHISIDVSAGYVGFGGRHNTRVGSVTGYSRSLIDNCTVSGKIDVQNVLSAQIGGVVGSGDICENSLSSTEIFINGTEYGSSSGVVQCGGIAGYIYYVNNCINYGNITASADSFLQCGGISGENGKLDSCTNYGNISGKVLNYKSYSSFGGNCNVGGIVGLTNSTKNNNCTNYGDISSTKNDKGARCYSGGVAGYLGSYNQGNISNCYNYGKRIVADDNCAGRVVGILWTDNATNLYSSSKTLVNGSIPTEDIGLDKRNGANIEETDAPESTDSVYFLSGWDAATRTVQFGDNTLSTPITYTVADGVDVSNIDSLLNKYVLVTMEQGGSSLEYTITDIQPVESKIGTVSATGEHSLTIDGTTYPVREDYMLGFYDGKELLYHVSNGTIMDYDTLEERTGTLEAWDSAAGKVTIDSKTYPTNYMSDLSYLKNLDISSHPKVEYVVPVVINSLDYQPVLRLMVSSYETKVGSFTQYDSDTKTAFIDGQGYPVDASSCDLSSDNFNGKQVFFLLKNGKIVHMEATVNVKSSLRVVLSPQKVNVTYKDNKLSANEFDVRATVYHSCSYNFPDHYDRSVVYTAAGLRPITLSTIVWDGDRLSFSNSDLSGVTLNVGENQSGTVKITIDRKYTPKNKTETLVGTCTVTGIPTGGTNISARGTVNFIVKTDSAQTEKPEDSSEVKELAQQANDELNRTRIPFTLKRDVMKNIFGLSGKSLDRFQQELFTVIVMSEIPEQTLREKIDDKVLTKLFGKWKPDGISATNYTLPLVYEMETKDYGRVTVRFDCEIQAYNNPAFGMFIDVYYTIISRENGNLSAKHEFLGGGVNYDMQAFADTVWDLVEGELKSAYDLAWGNSANEVADWLFDDTVKKILNDKKTTFKDEVWKLCTWPTKNVVNKCPTNVYVYDESNNLCGAIEDDLVTKTNENFGLYVEGDTKYIIELEDGYTVKYVATDNGTMDVIVMEYAGYETPMRQIEHLNVPLTVTSYYTQSISDTVKPQVETYALVSESQTVLPANKEKNLLQLTPAEDDTEMQNTFTVTFDTNGGTISGSTTLTTDTDGKLVRLPSAHRSGYTFAGWFTAAYDGVQITTNHVFTSDTTVYAHWTKNSGGSSGGSSSDGNSSGGGSSSASYSITTGNFAHGSVSVSPKSASKGTKVTITATPDTGYKLEKLAVTGNTGNELELTNKGDGTYTFIMPAGTVKVEASFVAIEMAEAPWVNPFTDVAENAWYYNAVRFVSENGLMGGYGNGLFGVNDNLSRAQLAQILYNKEGKPLVNDGNGFSDVDTGAWYANAVTWAAANGIVSGYGNGMFGPNNPITREQLAVMLWRYSGSPAATNKELHFNDAEEISGYALEALRWAVENGILNGYGDGRLGPQGQATRAQVAQMLKNYLEHRQ